MRNFVSVIICKDNPSDIVCPGIEELRLVVGRPASSLQHVAAARHPQTDDVDPQEVIDPIRPYTFSLTIVKVPNTNEVNAPGVTTGNLFVISPGNCATYVFAAGTWLYTINDTAILSCVAYLDCGVYRREESGLLRIPQELVIPFIGQHIPESTSHEDPTLVKLWDRIAPYNHRFVELVFPFPYPQASVTGYWDVEPAGDRLDQVAETWLEELARRRALVTLEQRVMLWEREHQEVERADREMKMLLREPSEPLEGSSDDDEEFDTSPAEANSKNHTDDSTDGSDREGCASSGR